MNVTEVLLQLRSELERINQAILALEQLASGKRETVKEHLHSAGIDLEELHPH